MGRCVTPIDEVVRALDDLVAAGKVVAIGISDTPAWVVSRAVAVAELRGWTRPSAIQLPYSLTSRDPERELFPMAASLGLAVLTWGNLDGGVLSGKYTDKSASSRRYVDYSPNERKAKVVELVAEVAAEAGATRTQVCIAWILAQRQLANLIPIVGARTAAQLDENLGALEVELAPEARARLEEATGIALGFPTTFLAGDEVVSLIFGRTRALIDA